MEFGMIPYDGLTKEDFMLPETEQPFLPGNKNNAPLFYLGLSKWTYKEEEKKKNSPYPQPGTLPYYAKHFNAIELNATHYEIPSADKITKWRQSVEDSNFQFCPKWYKGISHAGKVDLHKTGLAKQFLQSMEPFKEKLGTGFLQVPDQSPVEDAEDLLRFLRSLPAPLDLSIELRNAGWFADQARFSSLVKSLNSLGKGLVITDSPGRRDAVHMQLSNATAFIRFNAQGDHELDLFRIDEWKKTLRSWYRQGLEKCYFFLHIHSREFEDDFISYARHELTF
ncbi:MAG TPA: DUF72 domain-containing protein [Ferruginibacter sp.]|nr:DUF72 domain-containing protein [Ferruginibacter sp.]